MPELKRLVLDYRSEAGELAIRALYSTQVGPGPGTKARAREVSSLVRTGLQDALEALQDGDVTMCGTSGFTQREDILTVASPTDVISETRVKETR
jgi:hypothetical protein